MNADIHVAPAQRRIAGLILTLAAGACGGDVATTGPSFAVSDSAGIQIVENRGADVPAPWRLQKVGELMTPDSALTAVPWGVAADPGSGQIYVVDRTGERVAVFDRDGRYLRTTGRRGQGPGEFMNASAATVGPFGALTVWDAGRGVLSRWSSEGDLLNEQRAPVDYWGPAFHEGPGSLVTVTSAPSEDGLEQRLVEVRGDEIRLVHTVLRELTIMELPCVTQPASRVFAPSVVWAARSDTLHVLKGPGFRIDSYVDGVPNRSLRRDVEPVTVTGALASQRAEMEYGALIRICGVSAEDVVRAVGHEERVSPVQVIATSPDGRMWVSRSLDGLAPIPVDVFDPAGRYEGTLQATSMPVAFVTTSRFVGLAVKEDTEELILSLYELEETGDQSAGAATDLSLPERHPGVREFRDCPQCPAMMELPPGSFLMGARADEDRAAGNRGRPAWTLDAERPQVEVTFESGFALGKFPVTFAEWDRCVEAGGCEYTPDDAGWGRDDRPVIHVARSDAEAYVRWLREITGEPYRLPSEAEWEYAARAGTTAARWWGDGLGSGNAICDGCGTRWDDRSTAPVGSLAPNPFGLHDMLGNVSEWVADCWHEDHVGAPPDGSARVETSPWWRAGVCERPVNKGGAFSYFTWTVRAAKRTYYHEFAGASWTERDSNSRGFRVARELN